MRPFYSADGRLLIGGEEYAVRDIGLTLDDPPVVKRAPAEATTSDMLIAAKAALDTVTWGRLRLALADTASAVLNRGGVVVLTDEAGNHHGYLRLSDGELVLYGASDALRDALTRLPE